MFFTEIESEMRRARDADQKESRRRDILAAARRLCTDADFLQVSMDAVAREAGLAKGTLYLYFGTKEHLYLAVLEEDLEQWLATLEEDLHRRGPGVDPADLALLVAHGLVERPFMTALLARLPTTLESNLDEDTARRFKLWLAGRISAFAPSLEEALAIPLDGQGLRLCNWIFSVILGVHQTTNPLPMMRHVIETTPELAPLRLEFERELAALLEILFRGLSATAHYSCSLMHKE